MMRQRSITVTISERKQNSRKLLMRGTAISISPNVPVGPMIFAQMGMLQAINRHRERVINPDRKVPHWGKRKLKRHQ